jgi:ComF family protein
LHLFLYSRCGLCLCALPGHRRLCRACERDLPWLPAPATIPQAVPVFCALAYEFPVDRLVTAAKFHGRLDHARLLGALLLRALRAPLARGVVPRPDALVPVPLHRRRLAGRGYNQALEIARPLARGLGLPLRPAWASRARETREQTGLAAAERRRNLRGAFLATPACAGLRIAVVDDVVTTGSTARALAIALRAAGAAECQVWAVARALPDGAQVVRNT